MEMERVPEAGYPIIGLPVAGFDRKRLWRNIPVVWKLGKSMLMARRIVRKFKPDVAIGVGGYASGPVLKAAQKAGVPTVIQEQNSYAGVTNKLLAEKASAICCAYEGMERFFPADRISLTGNPVRTALTECTLSREEAKDKLGFDPEKPLILAVGGSLGARTINRAMAKSLPAIISEGAQLLWQTGKLYIKDYEQLAKGKEGVKISAFISDMAVAYRAADLIVARAGACTISELTLLGKPAILVPSPNVAEDHQRKNAEALVRRGAARMILDAEADEKLTDEIIAMLGNDAERHKIASEALKMGLPEADEKIVDKIIELVTNGK